MGNIVRFPRKIKWKIYGLGWKRIIPVQKYRLEVLVRWLELYSNSSNATTPYERGHTNFKQNDYHSTEPFDHSFVLYSIWLGYLMYDTTDLGHRIVCRDATGTIYGVHDVRKIDYFTNIRYVSTSAQKHSGGEYLSCSKYIALCFDGLL